MISMIDMAKRKTRKDDILEKNMQQLLSFALSMISKNKEVIIKKISDAVNIKKTIRKYAIIFTLVLVAIVILLDGVGLIIESLFPALLPGTIHILMGIIIIIGVLIYERH
jgi:hypothetical protein